MKDEKKPQAFPYCGVGDELNYSKGMTLRDYFAAKAMQGFVSVKGVPYDKDDYQMAATASYRMADAMLEARKTKQ